MNLRRKVIVSAALAAALGLVSSLGFIALQARSVIGEQAGQVAELTATTQARRLEGVFAAHYASVYGNAALVQGSLAEHKPVSREQVNAVMADVLGRSKGVLAFSLGLEPNVLDGRDAAYVNSKGHDATGRFIPYWYRKDGQPTLEPLTGYDKDDWYLLPKKTLQDAPVEPYKYPVAGKDVLMTSLMTPIVVGGRFVGVAGADIDLSFLTDELGQIRPFGEGRVRLLSAGGRYIAHEEAAMVGQSMADLPGELAERLKRGEAVRQVHAGANGDLVRYLQPFAIGKAGTYWTLEVELPLRVTTASATHMTYVAGGIALLAMGLLVLTLAGLLTRILQPVESLRRAMADLSSGSADLRARLPFAGDDEIGQIATAYNVFMGRLQGLIAEVKQRVIALEGGVGKLAENSHQIAGHSAGQCDAAGAAAAGLEQITVSVASVSAGAGEVRAIAREASELSETAEADIDASAQGIAHIERTTSDLGRRVGALSEHSREIGSIVHVIGELAGQTNLLALNAAIEAARAGEQGRGFAVVADEVRKLAERTASSTQVIGQTIEQVQNDIAEAVREVETVAEQVARSNELSGQAVTSIRNIRTVAGQLAQQSADIAASLAEQSAASEDIARHVEKIASMSNENNAAVQSSDQAIEQLAQDAGQLGRQVAEFQV